MVKQKPKRISITQFAKRFSTETACRDYLAHARWPEGFICPACASQKHCVLSNGLYQCGECHHQTSVTAGTFMHRSRVQLQKWFLALYLVTQDKRGISATQLAFSIGVNYKTAWRMLKKIRAAMGQRDGKHLLSGVVEFDDAYIGGPTVGKKRGRGTEKAKVFVALSKRNGCPVYLKMSVTENIRKESVKAFAEKSIAAGATILSDACASYVPALKEYDHQPEKFDPNSGKLKWLHTIISNAKAFILGTYHGLPKKNLQAYIDEYCYRFSRRKFGADMFDRLVLAMVESPVAELNG
jgi:transposase-like protein